MQAIPTYGYLERHNSRRLLASSDSPEDDLLDTSMPPELRDDAAAPTESFRDIRCYLSIVYSATYQVPALYFAAADPCGSLCHRFEL